MSKSAGRSAIVGVGYSKILRDKGIDGRPLAVEASRAAIADAGLTVSDVDAVFEYAGDEQAMDIARMVGIDNIAVYGDYTPRGPSGLAAALGAHMAVASGACEVALCVRSVTREWGQMSGRALPRAAGPWQWEFPYGVAGGIIPIMGMKKQRRMATLGTKEEDYGQISLNGRRWSSLNDRAVMRELMTMDDYFNSRFVSEPLRLHDCDYPVTGACAVVITTADRAADAPKRPVWIDAIAMGMGWKPDFTYTDDFLFGGTQQSAATMWKRSSVTPADVDVAELYDGFTHIAMSWVEAMGLCGVGEFGDWVDGGKTIGPGGTLPLNTSGGQLAEGRLHGLGFLAEAAAQLRGECGQRQVPDAQVAVVANGFGPQTGSCVLTV
jgi:acetyl-CoA acetyltransferase